MPHTLAPCRKANALSFIILYQAINKAMIGMPPLESQGNRPLKMSFEDYFKALIFFHLEEHTPSQHLLHVLVEDDFARKVIAPEWNKNSSFSEVKIHVAHREMEHS